MQLIQNRIPALCIKSKSSFHRSSTVRDLSPQYLTQHHSCEDSLEVGKVVVAEVGYNASVQQHQLERTRLWSDTDHHGVPQVSEGCLPLVLRCDSSSFTGTSDWPPTLDENVARVEIPVDEVIYKHLDVYM